MFLLSLKGLRLAKCRSSSQTPAANQPYLVANAPQDTECRLGCNADMNANGPMTARIVAELSKSAEKREGRPEGFN